jgi:hypothetical protein
VTRRPPMERTSTLVEPGQDRETNPNVAPLAARIRWHETEICLDFTCRCGQDGHVDTDKPVSPLHVRCSGCATEYRLNPRIQIVPLTAAEAIHVRLQQDGRSRVAYKDHGEDRSIAPNTAPLRADLQWKGTAAVIESTCACGQDAVDAGLFLCQVECDCGVIYRCNNRLQAIPLTDAECARARELGITPVVAEPDDEDFDGLDTLDG